MDLFQYLTPETRLPDQRAVVDAFYPFRPPSHFSIYVEEQFVVNHFGSKMVYVEFPEGYRDFDFAHLYSSEELTNFHQHMDAMRDLERRLYHHIRNFRVESGPHIYLGEN
jgi:hypothetical protein